MAKAVLRDSMRGIVPDRILDNRRKVGFNAPIHSLARRAATPRCARSCWPTARSWSTCGASAIEELLERDWLPNSESKFLFNFLSAKLFLEEFER